MEKQISIPFTDCPIGLLTGDAERYAWYLSKLGVFLNTFPQVDTDSYWRLTVAEHQVMWEAADG